jgi:methylthioribose-1-phosphate isomerase
MDAIHWQGTSLTLLDQTMLPVEEVWLNYTDYRKVADAISRLVVRGAPAIGIAAAYAYCLAAMQFQGRADFEDRMAEARNVLAASRPTAVNLFWALDRMDRRRAEYKDSPDLITALLAEAVTIHRQDVVMNRTMGRLGKEVVPEEGRVLTYCNAGAIATGGVGTALGVVRYAFRRKKLRMVYACETRPLLQGARLTAWELQQDQIPVTLITDNMAAALMAKGQVDVVLLGCDRMAANGDFANKIGTYSVAISAYFHSIPFTRSCPPPASTCPFPMGKGSSSRSAIRTRSPISPACRRLLTGSPYGIPPST